MSNVRNSMVTTAASQQSRGQVHNAQDLRADANINARGGPSLKNVAAFHELMRREGWAVPAISSKFINLETLTFMYTEKIYNLR